MLSGNGLPFANGKGRSYYLSGRYARRMLVVERRAGESLRINGGIKVDIFLRSSAGLVSPLLNACRTPCVHS